jgi:hypothetical protein
VSACSTCGLDAVVQWRRLKPGTTAGDTTAVYACPDHALTPEAAAQVHLATCAGPDKTGACKCPAAGPEFPFPGPDTGGPGGRKRLPPRW